MKQILAILACLAIASSVIAKNDKKEKKQKGMPPGLEKKIERGGNLPPGWQKKLVKGEVIDEGLYDIAILLPNKPSEHYPLTKGTELLRIENRIIRIKNDTKEILEILGINLKL